MDSTLKYYSSNNDARILIHLKSVDSTNTILEELYTKERLGHGSIVQADFQTAGRGMSGNSWHSESGKNLLFSYLFKLNTLNVSRQFYLSKTASLAIREVLQKELPGSSIEIKWPNDIMANGCKIGGILIQCSLKSDVVQHAIIGIGMNINQLIFPDSIRATSMKAESGREFRIDEILDKYREKMDLWMKKIDEEKWELLDGEYHKYLMGFGKSMTFSDRDGDFEGSIEGVREDGRMVLRKKDGKKRVYEVKEISLRTV